MELNTPSKGFVENYSLYRTRKPSVTLVVRRNVVEPLLIRNSNSDRAETQEFGEQLHAQANGEKFVSKERLTGLDLLRDLNEDEDLIANSYTYNELETREEAINLDVLTYGSVGTEDRGENFAFKSHVIEGYTYTTREYDLMNKEVRNAGYESGTMHNEDMMDEDDNDSQSTSLFELVKVQPGNSFIHFVTVESGTPEMLIYTLHNILNTEKYGARETRSGKNISNEILGVILGDHDTSLSTGELLMNYDVDDVENALQNYIQDKERADWEVYGEKIGFKETPDWFQEMKEIASLKREDSKEKLREAFVDLTETAEDKLDN
ncbi:MAG: type I-D CRISPR-associated protein Cas7/Csc2 [Candidatus Nanohaloarchaea archaeon]